MTSDDNGDQETFGFLLIFILISAPLILTLITVLQLFRVATSTAKRSCCNKGPSDDESSAGSNDQSEVGDSRSQSIDRSPSTGSRNGSALLGSPVRNAL